MPSQSVSAYDMAERVALYDADMEIMHPNRGKMTGVALQVLPFSAQQPVRALDLGVGTGYFTERFLSKFPSGEIWAVDGAAAMVELAKNRLGPKARVHFVVADFRVLGESLPREASFDVVFSSFSLHHLGRADKEFVVRQAVSYLKTGGWFVNADIHIAECPKIEERIQELRVAGIVDRARGRDARFVSADATRAFLDQLETRDGDQPLTLGEDLEVLRGSGLQSAAIFWLEFREAVYGGIK